MTWDSERRLSLCVPIKNPLLPQLLRQLAVAVEEGLLAEVELSPISPKSPHEQYSSLVGDPSSSDFGWWDVTRRRGG